MRKLLLLAVVLGLPLSMVVSQTLSDYVSETRGDTLVIKDYVDMSSTANSLYNAMLLDSTDVPAGRVYMLRTNGYYPCVNNPSPRLATEIVGEDPTILVNNSNASSAPPVICGASYTGGYNTGSMSVKHNLLVKNVSIVPADAAGDLGWAFFGFGGNNLKLTLDNCMMERTRWVMINQSASGSSIVLKNCYFVNMVGQSCRRNGGVYDGFSNLDTMWVENCTHVVAQGTMYKFRGYPAKCVVFNHNTFVDCAGYFNMDWGYQTQVINTNNIFVNCNIQPYAGLDVMDVGEQDLDKLPMGFVNVHDFPNDSTYGSYVGTPRRYLFENNVVYFDNSRFGDVVSTLNSSAVNGVTDWKDQMIVMNSRTTSMFADSSTYPYLVLGSVYSDVPDFTDSQDLLTTEADNVKTFVLSTMDTSSTAVMDAWRLVNIGSDYYVYSDWPIPVNLAYSKSAYVTGGTSGYPLGDLNWFPTQKAAWSAQSDAEYATLNHEIGATAVRNPSTQPNSYQLDQNYPNPFNPSTTISFSLARAGNVTLKVFNALGQEVTTLVNGFTPAGSHQVRFNATNLASGVYFYKIQSGDFSQVKKMMLLK